MEEVTEKKQPKNQKGAEGENNHSGTSIPKTVTVEEVTEEKQPKNQKGAEGENNHSGTSIPKTVTVEEVTEEKQPKNQEGAEGRTTTLVYPRRKVNRHHKGRSIASKRSNL